MNFKIINLEKYDTELCLARHLNDDGENIVLFTAFIQEEDETEIMLQDKLLFHTPEMAEDFIEDYSENSAENWIVNSADEQGINLIG